MKKFVSGLFLVLLVAASGFAQKPKTSPDAESGTRPVRRQSEEKAARSSDIKLQSGTEIEAQLQQTLDVENASVGDRVILTTTKAINQNGRTVVPKGAQLIGRVTEVRQKTKDNAQSKLGVVFERLEGKNLSSPISAAIVSITQASAAATLGDTFGGEAAGSANSSGNVSRSNSGGGLLGGVTNTAGTVINTTASAVGGVTNTANGTLDGTTRSLGGALNGIRLTQSTDASANGATIATGNKNLRLEKGVTFQLRLSQTVEN
jgi:hypothetical protein